MQAQKSLLILELRGLLLLYIVENVMSSYETYKIDFYFNVFLLNTDIPLTNFVVLKFQVCYR